MPDIFDPYRPKGSAFHRADARLKLVLTLAAIVTTAALPTGAWPAFALLFAGVVSLSAVSKLGALFVARRGLIAIPFALAALPLIFTTAGQPLAAWHLAGWTLTATAGGLERFASIAVKSWLSVQFGVLLTATTRFSDLLVAMRALHVPRLLVAIFGLMWRYLFLLVHEAKRLRIARDARSAEVGSNSGGTLAWRARTTGGMVGNLFLRGYERSERVYSAMLARGYDGEVRMLAPLSLSPREWIALAAGGFWLALATLLGFLFG